MKRIFIIFICASKAIHGYAQTQNQKDSLKNVNLNTVIISANKFAEKRKNISQKIDVVSSKEMTQMNAQTTADVLINTGQVFVQKSQQGGGSPVLRGFEASRIQLNIDGIRQNNAISRSGHMQNIISMDNNALERIEVLNGPGSTIHGSDAMGGVILMKTKDPKHGKTSKVELTGSNAMLRFSSANLEKAASAGFTFGNQKLASLTQLTFSNFDDLIQGKQGPDSIMNLWKKRFIVERINGKDSMVSNPNPYRQVSTGYTQFDVLQKFSIIQSERIKHGINLQLSNTSNIPRYDRLSETAAGVARNAEWYYGPQARTLAAYNLDVVKMKGFFNDLTFNLNHQYWKESRHNRGYNKSQLNNRFENVNVVGYNVALRHKDDRNEVSIGTDAQFNTVKSTAVAKNVNTGIESLLDTRYPDGGNRMNLFGVFYQHILKLKEGKVVINDGLRFNYTSLRSTLQDTSILFRLPFNVLEQKNTALTGNIGIVYMPEDVIRITLNLSSGFRSPNIDDMAKVFESVSGQRLIVPNVDLKPEFTRNIDFGIQYNNGKLDISAYGFYTHFTNAIVTDKYTFNGQDSVWYDGQLTPVFANQNKAKAFLYGGGLSASYRPSMHFSIYGSINYTYGRFNNDSVLIPLDHIPPVIGRMGVKYETKTLYADVYSLYNSAKRLSDYNPNGEDNLQYATPNGMPAWYTLNFRTGFSLTKNMSLQLGMENILDKNYRYFASGMSAPGRNIVVAMRFRN